MVLALRMVGTASPLPHIKFTLFVQRDWVTIEKIWHHHKIALASELIRDYLRIQKPMTNNICQSLTLLDRKFIQQGF